MGINVSNVMSATDVTWDRVADVFTSVRISIGWPTIESSAGVYSWEATDAAVDAITSHGLTCVFIFAYGNTLYSASWNTPPLSGTAWDAWEAFVQEAVTRYKDKRVFYEVWNEPYSATFWQPTPNPEDAGSFVAKTCRVIRGIKKDAYIITGGGFPINSWWKSQLTVEGHSEAYLLDYIKRYIGSGGAADADAVSLHPYTMVHPPEYARQDLEVLRGIIGKPLIVTEMGASEGRLKKGKRNGTPPAWFDEWYNPVDIARYFTRYMCWANSVGIPASYWFHYSDFYVDPLLDYTVYPAKKQQIKSITAVTTTATVTTCEPHGLATSTAIDNTVTIEGALQSEYNGTFYITRTGATTFTYTMKTAPTITTATCGVVPMTYRTYGYDRSEKNYGMCEEIDATPRNTGGFVSGAVSLAGSRYVKDVEVISKGALYEDPAVTFCGRSGSGTQAKAVSVLNDAGAVIGFRFGELGDELLTSSITWSKPADCWTGDNTDGWTYEKGAITGITLTADADTTAKAETATAHGLTTDDVVVISGATGGDAALYNITATVLASGLTETVFKYTTLTGLNEAGGAVGVATPSVVKLRTNLAATDDTLYRVDIQVDYGTVTPAGSLTVAYGNDSIAGVTASKSWFPQTTDVDPLVITPTSDFNGIVTFSVKILPNEATSGDGYLDRKSSLINEITGAETRQYLTNATVIIDAPPAGGKQALAFPTRSLLLYCNTFDKPSEWTATTPINQSTAVNGWKGDAINGFKHTSGTTALTNTYVLDASKTYTLAVRIEGLTPAAGSVGITVMGTEVTIAGQTAIVASGISKAIISTGSSTASVIVTPTNGFDGTIGLALWETDAFSIGQIHLWQYGFGYMLAPDIYISEPPYLPTAKAVLSDGVCVGVDVIDPGAYPSWLSLGAIIDEGLPWECNYSVAVAAPVDAGGVAATVSCIENYGPSVAWNEISTKHMKALFLQSPGSLYENPMITCGNEPTLDPVLVPILKGGSVEDVRVVNPGGGFTPKAGALTSTGTTATFTVTSPGLHGFAIGDSVFISGAVPTAYNGTYTVLAGGFSTSVFTYTLSASTTSPATGTITAQKLVPTLAVTTHVADDLTATTLSSSGRTATFLATAASALQVGQKVTIAGASDDVFNGTFTILTVTTTTLTNDTFTYSMPTTPTDSTPIGTITATGLALVNALMGTVPIEEAPKPAYYAAKKMREMLEGYTFVAENSTNPNVHELEYTNGTKNIVVLWAEKLDQATVKTWVDGDGVLHISPVYPGYGYVSAPSVVFPGYPDTLIGTAFVDAVQSWVDGTNFDYGIKIVNRGRDYTSTPIVKFSGGGMPTSGGRVAQAAAWIADKRLGGVYLTNMGQSNRGYTSAPLMQIVGGGGYGAEVECTLGGVGTITLVGNTGFTTAPNAYLVGGFPTYTIPDTTRYICRYDGTLLPISGTVDITEDPIYVVYEL